MEWRDIATAPKIEDDVDRWIILNTSRGVTCGYWGPQYFGMDYTWVQWHHRSECQEVKGKVTHWMPLPEPPTPTTREE